MLKPSNWSHLNPVTCSLMVDSRRVQPRHGGALTLLDRWGSGRLSPETWSDGRSPLSGPIRAKSLISETYTLYYIMMSIPIFLLHQFSIGAGE